MCGSICDDFYSWIPGNTHTHTTEISLAGLKCFIYCNALVGGRPSSCIHYHKGPETFRTKSETSYAPSTAPQERAGGGTTSCGDMTEDDNVKEPPSLAHKLSLKQTLKGDVKCYTSLRCFHSHQLVFNMLRWMCQGPQAVNGGWQMLLQANPLEADHIVPVPGFLMLLFIEKYPFYPFCHLLGCMWACARWMHSKTDVEDSRKDSIKKTVEALFSIQLFRVEESSNSINMFPLKPKRSGEMNNIFI